MADIARIEDRIDRVAASTLEVSDALGGLRFQNMVEVMEFAKCMAVADTAVPKHLRGNPGMCLAVCVQALEWRFSPFAVANKSYVVNDRIGYESQLVHAVIEQRAPIIGRLKHRFDGEGDDRRCTVWATLRETLEVLEYTSPLFSKIQPKNSPLWKTKPDLQLYYNTSRDFCRAYFPDVLLGVYSQEELRDHVGPDNARDVNDRPSVGQRLKAKGARGFNASHVERETRGGVVEDSTKGGASHSETPQDAIRHESTTETLTGATDAQGHPDRAETVDDAKPRGTDDVKASEPETSNTSGSTDSNSSEPSPQTSPSEAQADAPAVESRPPPEAAGNLSESSRAEHAGDGEAQAGDAPHADAGLPSTLPQGWEIRLRDALTRARKPESLRTYAQQCFEKLGGVPTSPEDIATAKAIRAAFEENFGDANKDSREAVLRELI